MHPGLFQTTQGWKTINAMSCRVIAELATAHARPTVQFYTDCTENKNFEEPSKY